LAPFYHAAAGARQKALARPGEARASGKLGALIGDAFLPDLASRQKYLQAQVPGIVDLTLDDVLSRA
jgi:hypothetical protein